jgi:hypothetical protein
LLKARWARTFLSAALLLAGLFTAASFAAVGYQQVTVPDGDGKSLQAGIWYPSTTRPLAHPLGMFTLMAVTHIGDNTQDQRYVGNRIDLIDRPRQAKAALDWVLASWPGRLFVRPWRSTRSQRADPIVGR